MVFVNSGYTRYGGIPGNVLLAFAPRGQTAGREAVATERGRGRRTTRVNQHLRPDFPLCSSASRLFGYNWPTFLQSTDRRLGLGRPAPRPPRVDGARDRALRRAQRGAMWQHNYEPIAGSLGVSALVAAIPILVLFLMLGV